MRRCEMPKPPKAGLPAADVAAIRRLTDEWKGFMLAGDFESLAKCYTEDAVELPPGHPEVHGRDAIREWIAQFPKVTRFEIEMQHIDGRGDLAHVRGRYSMTLQPQGAPGPVEDTGKYLEVRRRQPDGSWLMAVDIFNSDK
jgi:uncharacterized protein (TIGR02246 family)